MSRRVDVESMTVVSRGRGTFDVYSGTRGVVSAPEPSELDAEDIDADGAPVSLAAIAAETTSTVDGLPDFEVYQVAGEFATDALEHTVRSKGRGSASRNALSSNR